METTHSTLIAKLNKMIKIKKVAATEELLKIYFFKLFSRKDELPIIFDEEIGNLICSKTFEEMNSKVLFSYCFIENRWGNESIYGSEMMPEWFYYFDDHKVEYENIESHPFLYTNINTIKNTQIVDANVHPYLSDLYDEKGKYLGLSIGPNLYDDGSIFIDSLNETLICITFYDVNNGEFSDLYRYNVDGLNKLDIISNKQEILEIINQNKLEDVLSFASEILKNDKEVVLAAINNWSPSLQYASEELKNDKEVVLVAVNNYAHALEYASEELKNDKEIILTAIRKEKSAFKYASKKLKNNIEFKQFNSLDFIDVDNEDYLFDNENLPF